MVGFLRNQALNPRDMTRSRFWAYMVGDLSSKCSDQGTMLETETGLDRSADLSSEACGHLGRKLKLCFLAKVPACG